MPSIRNGRVLFNSVPEGFPEPGKTTVYDGTQTIDTDAVSLNGGFLVKVLNLSIDPYLRGLMHAPKAGSYPPSFAIGEPLYSLGVGLVLRSENPAVKSGDHIYGMLEHREYVIKMDMAFTQVLENPHNLPWATFTGVLGMPGMTAFMAWKEFSGAKKGETVFVSTGAGAVGSLVIQLAKAEGLKVVGSAGSEEKVQFMKEIGADIAFNYKNTSVKEILEKEGPIDVYWDNVGGETLDAALAAANKGARVIACGSISGYNNSGAPIHNFGLIITKSITVHGFTVGDLMAKWGAEFNKVMSPMVASGEIKHREAIYEGLEHVGEAILAVQKGTNKAKAVVHVADA